MSIASDILKSRAYKNSICIHHNSTSSSNSSTSSTSGHETNKTAEHNPKLGSKDLSADSGYHSRLCVDQSHETDPDNCSCSRRHTLDHVDVNHRKSDVACDALEQETLVMEEVSQQLPLASMSKAHFESILKFILDDYMRLKSENEMLRSQMSKKDKSIDMLKLTMEECKVRNENCF